MTSASVFRLATTAVRVSAELSTVYTGGRQCFRSRCFDGKYVGDEEIVDGELRQRVQRKSWERLLELSATTSLVDGRIGRESNDDDDDDSSG